ncbi:fimbrial protein [Pantoea sp. CCBC3-3-1]|uniref:fimbrial protein n=1 Tax=Pantoea sp. CCBC3-3-1 TaxID=2490851 RepID=UPI0011BF93A9|nr:fimbrial protein [Pantoea sp. CCBC3-3-1]
MMQLNVLQKFGITAIGLAALSLALVYSPQASAFSCSLSEGNGVMDFTMPLQSLNLTVGPDVSNGTIIYRQYFKPSRATTINCTGNSTSYQPTISWSYSIIPNGISDWSGSPFGGKVYETGVPGVGIAIYTYNRAVDRYTVPFTYQAWQEEKTTDSASWVAQGGFEFDVVLIKTGVITPGTISGLQLPTVVYNFEAQNISPLYLGSLSFSGAINIVSRTCTTPDVVVEMGPYEIPRTFTKVGSYTEWKDASVILTDCPRFYGTLNDGRNTFNSDDGTSGTGTITNNVLNLTLAPNTSVIDSTNGILSLKTGTDAASGVGIQLAYGSETDTAPEFVNFSSGNNYTVADDALTRRTFPLIARYIQTESEVTAGRADATVTFTINYY